MKKAIVLISLMLATLLTSVILAQESRQKLYRIYVKDFSRIKTIENKGVTVYNQKPGSYIEVLALPEQIQNLGIEGAEVEFIANSFKELYQSQPGFKTIPGFHNYQSTMNELVDIASQHPEITRLDTIGYSVLGRAICCLKISDNPGIDEDEPPLLFVGNHHGNEIHSVEATLYQINYLIDNYGSDPEVTNWINTMEIWYIPMVNPDGREAMQRGNNHDVDLNRNYSIGFTAGGGHGPEAFSEPETRAIRDFTAQCPPVMSLTYHTSGQLLLYPWTHTDSLAPDFTAMVYLGNLISESITFTGGHYTLLQGGRWYFTAGEYCDYMYVTHNTLAYTVEMGTSQAPDYSVMSEMSESNLKGMKTMLRQTGRAGVTGLVTDAFSGLPVRAIVDIPSIDNQGKLPPRLADSLFGRYYRYLEPDSYTFQISAPGYRTIVREVTISPDSLTHWNIKMERAAFLEVDKVLLSDGKSGNTSGNGDGLINLGEMIGFTLSLSNVQSIKAMQIYAKISSANPNIRILTDSLYFGNIEMNSTKTSADTVLFRIDPRCPDGEDLELTISIGDSGGFGWFEQVHLEVYAPKLEISRIRIDDSDGNQNGAFDNGETVTIELQVTNNGRQDIHDLFAALNTGDPYFQVISDPDESDQLGIGEVHTFHFKVKLSSDAPKAYIADFNADITSAEGYSPTFVFQLNNIYGFYDDFESGVNGWVHHSYGTTSNNHDDWQLGTPAGKGGDPNHAFSGKNCWGNDMGWDSYDGTSWDGTYQANVYTYLSSPEIDCSKMADVGLKFMRWLNIRINDYARIKVNNHLVWESPQPGNFDSAWTEQIIDISDIADGNPAVTIIFELQTNNTATMGGWNIDDVIVANGLASTSASVETNLNPEADVLYDSYPSPFSLLATIKYFTSKEGPVELTIYDLTGSKVKTLISCVQPSGQHETAWDGKNANGQSVPSGIYFYQLKAGKFARAKRLILIN
ncbi:MAG: T9SS C-terminal target domain-containing protein [Porphyromonadaceae bacterium]|nr:MAG: T9SS C-terminal target domain-containing protein [Porphyromonadaceae bacterium]